MHEYSVMNQIVQTIVGEAEKNKLISVSKVTLEVGELTFLSEEALKFSFEVLTKDTILSSSELLVVNIKPEIACKNCGYKGDLEFLEDNEELHFRLPNFSCPKCENKIEIIKGKDCILKEITGDIE